MKAKAKYKLGHKAEQAVKRLMPAPAGGSNTERVVEHVYMKPTKPYRPKPPKKKRSQQSYAIRQKAEKLAAAGKWKAYSDIIAANPQIFLTPESCAPKPEPRPYFKDLPPSSHKADSEAVKRLTLAGVDQVIDTTTAIIKKQRSMAIHKGRAAAKAKRAKQAELDAIQSEPSIWNR